MQGKMVAVLAQDPPQTAPLTPGELQAKLLSLVFPAAVGAGALIPYGSPWWYKVIASGLLVLPGVVAAIIARARNAPWPFMPAVNPVVALVGAFALGIGTIAPLGEPLQVGVSIAAMGLYALAIEGIPGGVARWVVLRGSVVPAFAGTLMMQGFVLLGTGA